VGTVIQLFDRDAPVPADRRSLLLGRAFGDSPQRAVSPALMPDSAAVCRCNNVTKGAIVRAYRAGERDIARATTATTGCGGCRDAVDGIVAWLTGLDGAA